MKRSRLAHQIESLGMDYFSVKDLRKIFPDDAYIKISVNRLLKRGELIKLARGIYALHKEKLDIEKIATQLYYPSYISFESALSKYGIINQGLFGLTLATTRHTKKLIIAETECYYSKIKPSLFNGFDLIDGTYVAFPEKAILDQLYSISLGKRKINTAEWYLEDINRQRICEFAEPFPESIKHKVSELGLM